MNTQIEREQLKKVFKDPMRVDKMSDAQVIAIYAKFKAQGKLVK